MVKKYEMKMTPRQRILKLIYPVLVWVRQKSKKEKVRYNDKLIPPPISFYNLSLTLNNGKEFQLQQLKGKKVLLVNTASDCGYTAQYAALQKLYDHAHEDLEIIGFPANDFKEQEKGNDEEIAQFCVVNFGVRFPLAKKSSVLKSDAQNPIFTWLTNATKNGWNDQAPAWNFSKYLLNEQGVLTHYFPPSLSPLSKEILTAVHQ
ncbi:MAG: glutathione peroxidase [Bacteroidota bacterium]|nr:glutathione peroxidase [Bacteroidota bacterium]